MRSCNWILWAWAAVVLASAVVAAPAMADPVEATISLGRDPEPPFCVMNPGGELTITWSIEYSTTPLRVIYTLMDPTQTITLDSETYPGATGVNITRYWTAPMGLVDGKYWVRVEYWSFESGNEANAEVTFYLCSELGTICAEKWQDSDCDEVLTAADAPVAGWWICLDTPYDETYCQQTGPDGRVCWNDIVAGEYTIWEFLPGGWRSIYPTSYDIVLENGETETAVFFNTQCPPPSACCFPDGSCQVLPVGTCAAMGGVVIPDVTCDPNPCPTQACCFPDGSCALMLPYECVAAGGTVYPDLTCDPNPCPQPPEYACCFEDGSCLVLTEEDCVAQGGVVYAVEDCDPNPCPPPEYACCLPLDENCYMLTQEACLAAGGIWHDGEICSAVGGTFDCPLWRVCCIGEDCFILTEVDCLAQGGIWHVDWTSCEPENPCEIPVPVTPDSWGAIKSVYR